MSIIPNGKSEQFKSELSKFKNAYSEKILQDAYDNIPYVDDDISSIKSIAKKKKKRISKTMCKEKQTCEPKKLPEKWGKEAKIKTDSKIVKQSEDIKEKKIINVTAMSDEDKKKVKQYWLDLLGSKELADAMVQDY